MPPYQHPTSENIEVEFIPEKTNPSISQTQQVVQQADPLKKMNPSEEKPARFLSEKTQRVEEETQASVPGLTQNRNQKAANLKLSQLTKTSREMKNSENQEQNKNPGASPTAEKEMEEFAQQIDRIEENNSSRQQGPSTRSDFLPSDVAVGSITALNTDRLTYYSFFSRVNQAIYFRWNSRVRNALDSFDNNYFRNVVRLNRWVTEAEILIRPDGRVHKVLLMKESGILRFDLAAVNAFKEAAIFPNPPQEMIQDDGFIHLKYSFSVAIN